MAERNDLIGLELTLLLGPHEGGDGTWSLEQLRRGWATLRDRLMAPAGGSRPADRPWAFWRFDLGREPPESYFDQVLCLLVLRELGESEIAELRERARAALRDLAWVEHCQEVGAVATTPPDAAERARERRDKDAEGWQRVLEALA